MKDLNKKKISLLLAFVLLAMSLTACGAKPDKSIEEFVGFMRAFDLENMAENILVDGSVPAKDIIARDTDLGDMPDSYVDYLKDNASKIEYEILETKLDGETGTAKIKFKYVDGTPVLANVMKEYMGELINLAKSEPLSKEALDKVLVDLLEKHIEETEVTFVEEELEIPLKKIDGAWYIDGAKYELFNVTMSNYIRLLKEVEEKMNGVNVPNPDGLEETDKVEEEVTEEPEENKEESKQN